MSATLLLKKLALILYLPGAIGILGFVLAFERSETWAWRTFGMIIAIVMIPFTIFVIASMIVYETFEKIGSGKNEKI